jgi:hypothetical protein
MSDDVGQMGPIDYLVIEFPGSHLSGEGLPLLVELVDRDIIRILDLLFVKKLPDGSVTGLDLSGLNGGATNGLGVFAGARSGLLGDEDIQEVGGVLRPGNSAAVVIYENRWAAPLAAALRRADGQVVAGGRVPADHLLAVLDAVEKGERSDAEPVRKGW